MKKVSVLIVVLLALIPVAVFAHPGHGHFDGYNLFHFVTSVEHILQLIGLALVGVGITYFIRRWNPIRIKK